MVGETGVPGEKKKKNFRKDTIILTGYIIYIYSGLGKHFWRIIDKGRSISLGNESLCNDITPVICVNQDKHKHTSQTRNKTYIVLWKSRLIFVMSIHNNVNQRLYLLWVYTTM